MLEKTLNFESFLQRVAAFAGKLGNQSRRQKMVQVTATLLMSSEEFIENFGSENVATDGEVDVSGGRQINNDKSIIFKYLFPWI